MGSLYVTFGQWIGGIVWRGQYGAVIQGNDLPKWPWPSYFTFIFKVIDKDSSGYIDKKELKAIFKKIGMKVSDEDIAGNLLHQQPWF